MDALSRLRPPAAVGERLSLRLSEPARDLIGVVTRLDPLTIEDRHGRLYEVEAGTVLAVRRVGVPLGRDPRSAPRDLLDDLATRAGLDAAAEPVLHRLSDLLANRKPPTSVFAQRGEWHDGVHAARVEGEWLSTDVTDPELLVALGWWASRQNARSVQVRPR